jgi:hypothetical protein
MTKARAVAALLAGLCSFATNAFCQAPAANSNPPGFPAVGLAGRSELSITADEVRRAVSGKTNMTFSPDFTAPPIKRYDASGKLVSSTPPTPTKGTGTQVEYLSPDGKAYLWYPGNNAMAVGTWSIGAIPLYQKKNGVDTKSDLPTLCFQYVAAAGSIVQGGTCAPAHLYLRRVTESVNGDVLGLSRRSTPPFVLSRDKTTLDALKKRAGS